MKDALKLTDRQKLFCEEYLIDFNATRAYGRAGYAGSGNGAEVNAHKLLKLDKITAYIQSAMDKRSQRVQITADDVMRDIDAVKANAMQIVTDRDGNQTMLNHAAAIKALELHGKHLKLFTDKTELSGNVGLIVEIVKFGDSNETK